MSPLTSDEQEKLGKIFAESWARDAERNKQRRVKTGELEIELERAPTDLPVNDRIFQTELSTFGQSLKKHGILFSQSSIAFDSIETSGYPLAEFVIKTLGVPAISIVTVAISGWLTGRAGRKARIRFGDIEAEGRTPEEVEQLLQSAAAFRASIKGADKEE